MTTEEKIREAAQTMREAAVAASVLIDNGHHGTARELVNVSRFAGEDLIRLLNNEVPK